VTFHSPRAQRGPDAERADLIRAWAKNGDETAAFNFGECGAGCAGNAAEDHRRECSRGCGGRGSAGGLDGEKKQQRAACIRSRRVEQATGRNAGCHFTAKHREKCHSRLENVAISLAVHQRLISGQEFLRALLTQHYKLWATDERGYSVLRSCFLRFSKHSRLEQVADVFRRPERDSR